MTTILPSCFWGDVDQTLSQLSFYNDNGDVSLLSLNCIFNCSSSCAVVSGVSLDLTCCFIPKCSIAFDVATMEWVPVTIETNVRSVASMLVNVRLRHLLSLRLQTSHKFFQFMRRETSINKDGAPPCGVPGAGQGVWNLACTCTQQNVSLSWKRACGRQRNISTIVAEPSPQHVTNRLDSGVEWLSQHMTNGLDSGVEWLWLGFCENRCRSNSSSIVHWRLMTRRAKSHAHQWRLWW